MAGGDFCTSCGARREGAGRFCGSCGQPFGEPEASSPEVPPSVGGNAGAAPEGPSVPGAGAGAAGPPARPEQPQLVPSSAGDGRGGGAWRGALLVAGGAVALALIFVVVLAMSGRLPWFGGDTASSPDLIEQPTTQWTFDVGEQLVLDDGVTGSGDVWLGWAADAGGGTLAVTPSSGSEVSVALQAYGVDSSTGEVVWAGPPLAEAESGSWFFCVDVVDGTVPCFVNQESGSFVAGLDAGDGTVRWRYELNGSTGRIERIGSDIVVVAADQGAGDVHAARLSAETGAEVWATSGETSFPRERVAVSESYILIGSQPGLLVHADTGAAPFAVDDDVEALGLADGAVLRFRDGVVERLDDNGVPMWSREGRSFGWGDDLDLPWTAGDWEILSTSTGQVLVASWDGDRVEAVDVETGDVRWATAMTPDGETYVGATGSVMLLLTQTAGPTPLSTSRPTPDPTAPSSAASPYDLRAVDLETGEQVWRRPANLSFEGPWDLQLHIGEQQVYFFDRENVLSAFDLETGQETWRTRLPEWEVGNEWFISAGDGLYVRSGPTLSRLE